MEPEIYLCLKLSLNGSNYAVWECLMKTYIIGQRCVGHIDESIPIPPQVILKKLDGSSSGVVDTESNLDYKECLVRDMQVIASIRSTLSEEILFQVIDIDNARQL